MSADPVDLLIIGGGITGAGIARDAAMRGIRTAIVDKADFGSGTSSRSSRMVHGGLRYLEMRDFRLVFEACSERRTLLRIAPHLVWPRQFLFPIHEGSRVPLWKLRAGLFVYDALAMFRNVGRHRILSRRKVLRREPNLRANDLEGAGVYYDAQCNDARLTLANIRAAHEHGALAANYARVDGYEREEGRVVGVRVTDTIGQACQVIRAGCVVNATGPWSDELGDRPEESPALRRSKGVHVAVPRARVGNQEAVTLISPLDGRVMFIVPWGELSYIGTTDTDDNSDPDETRATADDVIYLLRSANAVFPTARLAPDDVVSTWSGVRPLVAAGNVENPSAVSREHRILESASGVVSIVGGKLTTYRSMAAEVVDHVATRLPELDGRARQHAPTDREPLPGGGAADLTVITKDIEHEGFAPDTAEYLTRELGTEAPAVVRLAQSRPEWAKPLVPGHPGIRAQLIHAVRREMAMTLPDLLLRRTHLFFEVMGHGVPEVPGLVDLVAEELGWDGGRKATELADYLQIIQHGMAFRDELGV